MSSYHPSVLMALVVILSISMAMVLMVLGVLWTWLRTPTLVKTARLVDDLAERQRDLESLMTRFAEVEAVRSDSGSLTPSPAPAPAPAPAPGRAPAHRVDPAMPARAGGPTLIAVPNLAAPSSEASAAAVELGRRFGAIWDLADAGASPEAIARSIGQPVGQVELILSLRRQLGAASRGDRA